jgi:hypothetical protein
LIGPVPGTGTGPRNGIKAATLKSGPLIIIIIIIFYSCNQTRMILDRIARPDKLLDNIKRAGDVIWAMHERQLFGFHGILATPHTAAQMTGNCEQKKEIQKEGII